jgi:hypothetical protein
MRRILVASLFLLVSIPCLSIPPLGSRSSGLGLGEGEFVLSLRSFRSIEHAGGWGIRGGLIQATKKSGLGVSVFVEFNSVVGDDLPGGIRYPLNEDSSDYVMESTFWITGEKSLDFLFGAEFSLQNIAPSLPFDLLINADAGIGLGSESSIELDFDHWSGGYEIHEGPGELSIKWVYRFGLEGHFTISADKIVGIGYKWEHCRWGPPHDFKLSPNSLEAFIRFRK